MRSRSTAGGGARDLGAHLGDFGDVVVALLEAKAREAQRRLPSPAVLLGQLDRDLVEDLARVLSILRSA